VRSNPLYVLANKPITALWDYLAKKEQSAITNAVSLVEERFETEQERFEYYEREKRLVIAYKRGTFGMEPPKERIYARTLKELGALGAELNDPDALAKRVIAVLRDIERLRGNAVIVYFAALGLNRNGIYIFDDDLDRIKDMIKTIPQEVRKLDFIVHSGGGVLESAARIVKLLRSRFEEVNFLLPRNAYSAVCMMAMSANEIIMSDTTAFTPFDPVIQSGSGKYLRTDMIKTIAKDVLKSFKRDARKARIAFPGWSQEEAKVKFNEAGKAEVRYGRIAVLWLVKYMFGHSSVKIWAGCNATLLLSKLLAALNVKRVVDCIKAERIVKFFTNTNLHLSHDDPLTYEDVSGLGLKVSLASGELDDLMRETYLLNQALFRCSNAPKAWYSTEDYHLAETATKTP
jgi:hypothetical protein